MSKVTKAISEFNLTNIVKNIRIKLPKIVIRAIKQIGKHVAKLAKPVRVNGGNIRTIFKPVPKSSTNLRGYDPVKYKSSKEYFYDSFK